MNKLELAQDPNTSPEVLEELATDENYFVRHRAIKHLNCSIKLLEKLATDEDYGVRYYVARNPNCPEYIKTYLVARNFIERF